MANEQNFLKNISAIDSAIHDDTENFAISGKDELCSVFKKIKGPVEAILPVVKLIPVYGAAIAKALQLLLQFGEAVCPAA